MDSELSSEMMTEIMSRTSLKTLGIMRCASKLLNTLTYESYLLDLYKTRNKIVSGFLVQNTRRGCIYIKKFAPSPQSNTLDLSFLPYNARILATSDHGIMLFQDHQDSYHVCKPTTTQVCPLPKPKGNHTVLKFAIVVMGSNPLHYKIIRFSDHPVLRRWRKFYSSYRCDIFDSMTWKWRTLKPPITLDYCVFLTNPQPVTKSGSIYMLLTNNNILKFDAYSEKWQVFSSPIPYDESRTLTELVKYGERLGLASKPPDSNRCWEIRVCTMDGSWENEGAVVESKSEMESLKALYDLHTSVMVDYNTLLFYRFEQDRNNMIGKVVLNEVPYQIFSFRSDFEPVDLRCI